MHHHLRGWEGPILCEPSSQWVLYLRIVAWWKKRDKAAAWCGRADGVRCVLSQIDSRPFPGVREEERKFEAVQSIGRALGGDACPYAAAAEKLNSVDKDLLSLLTIQPSAKDSESDTGLLRPLIPIRIGLMTGLLTGGFRTPEAVEVFQTRRQVAQDAGDPYLDRSLQPRRPLSHRRSHESLSTTTGTFRTAESPTSPTSPANHFNYTAPTLPPAPRLPAGDSFRTSVERLSRVGEGHRLRGSAQNLPSRTRLPETTEPLRLRRTSSETRNAGLGSSRNVVDVASAKVEEMLARARQQHLSRGPKSRPPPIPLPTEEPRPPVVVARMESSEPHPPLRGDKLDFTKKWLNDDLGSLAREPGNMDSERPDLLQFGPREADLRSVGSASAEIEAIISKDDRYRRARVPDLVPLPQRGQAVYKPSPIQYAASIDNDSDAFLREKAKQKAARSQAQQDGAGKSNHMSRFCRRFESMDELNGQKGVVHSDAESASAVLAGHRRKVSASGYAESTHSLPVNVRKVPMPRPLEGKNTSNQSLSSADRRTPTSIARRHFNLQPPTSSQSTLTDWEQGPEPPRHRVPPPPLSRLEEVNSSLSGPSNPTMDTVDSLVAELQLHIEPETLQNSRTNPFPVSNAARHGVDFSALPDDLQSPPRPIPAPPTRIKAASHQVNQTAKLEPVPFSQSIQNIAKHVQPPRPFGSYNALPAERREHSIRGQQQLFDSAHQLLSHAAAPSPAPPPFSPDSATAAFWSRSTAWRDSGSDRSGHRSPFIVINEERLGASKVSKGRARFEASASPAPSLNNATFSPPPPPIAVSSAQPQPHSDGPALLTPRAHKPLTLHPLPFSQSYTRPIAPPNSKSTSSAPVKPFNPLVFPSLQRPSEDQTDGRVGADDDYDFVPDSELQLTPRADRKDFSLAPPRSPLSPSGPIKVNDILLGQGPSVQAPTTGQNPLRSLFRKLRPSNSSLATSASSLQSGGVPESPSKRRIPGWAPWRRQP